MTRDERTTARQILHLLRRVHMQPVFFLIPTGLFLLSAVFDGVGMGLLIPLLTGFLQKDFSFLKETPLLGTILAALPAPFTERDRTLFLVLLAVFILVILLKNVLRYAATVSMSYLGTRAVHHLRKGVFQCYLRCGKLYFDQTTAGHHSTVLSQFTAEALAPLLFIDRSIHALLSIGAYLAVMSLISWKLTVFAIPIFFVLHTAVRWIVERIRRLSGSIAQRARALGKVVVEIISTIPLVKAANTEAAEQHHYAHISDERARLEFRLNAFQQLIHPLQEIITLLAILLLTSFMLYLLTEGQQGTVSSFLVYFYLVLNATNKFGTLTGFRANLANATGPLAEVLEVFRAADAYEIPDGRRAFTGLQRRIEFRNLTFGYGRGRPVLHGLSFTLEQGTMTAIVGPTGAGKTTIVSLLLRYYDCPPGTLLLDGVDIREWKISSLRSHIAFVSQETLLLHDTLRRNITYGLGAVSEERVIEAVQRARLSEYVRGLPQGLETLIGDRGVKLSGGEKQRVSLARALLKEADILILDEATSSLDSRTERLIQEAIADAIRGKTAIVIAHRLSTIKHADHIVVLEDGRCIEEGPLQVLLAKEGKFHAAWEEQKFF